MKEYYRLIKPGIVWGNALPALAAFIFAAHRSPSVPVMVAMLVGLSASIAGACVLNNILDRDIDARMERTKVRALPNVRIPLSHALVFASTLLIAGLGLLLLAVNTLSFLVTLFGVLVYVGLYTPLKRTSVHSTIVGALAGAVPPVVGYVAVTNAVDRTALALFLVLITWQMVHFFAIGIFRKDEYAAAGLPVMPVRYGTAPTKAFMLLYALLFAGSLAALSTVASLGSLFTYSLGALAVGWIGLGAYGFAVNDDARWASTMFLASIAILLAFSFALALS